MNKSWVELGSVEVNYLLIISLDDNCSCDNKYINRRVYTPGEVPRTYSGPPFNSIALEWKCENGEQ